VSLCSRPIDPIDAAALAAGADPAFAADAAEHVRLCAACREGVQEAVRLAESLEAAGGEPPVPDDLGSRVVRLRAFSARERRAFALWRGACGLAVGAFVTGVLLLTLPGLTAHEQAGLGISAAAPLLLLLKALARAAGEALTATPSGLEALSQALRQQQALGLAALALLVPVAFGLRRSLARVRR
jgi:predicted anti-sigma-YlaC factor YlaD